MADTKRCVLVGGGDFCLDKFLREKDCAVVGVDSGYAYVKDVAQVCCAVGDFDSLGYVPQDVPTVAHSPIKDYTDMYLALEHMSDKGYSEFVIYGGLGGRLDHTIANLQTAYGFVKKGFDVKLVDRDCEIEFIVGKKTFTGRAGSAFSLFALDECRGVSVCGAKYGLSDAVLTNGFPLGVSNEFTDVACEISVVGGALCFVRMTRQV